MKFNSTQPLYLQIADMIRQSILSGTLQEDGPVPSVRQVSVEHELNPQTVLNATRLLMQEGVLEKRRGVGMFVASGARKQLMQQELTAFRSRDIPALVNKARALGLSQKKICDLVKDAYKE